METNILVQLKRNQNENGHWKTDDCVMLSLLCRKKSDEHSKKFTGLFNQWSELKI